MHFRLSFVSNISRSSVLRLNVYDSRNCDYPRKCVLGAECVDGGSTYHSARPVLWTFALYVSHFDFGIVRCIRYCLSAVVTFAFWNRVAHDSVGALSHLAHSYLGLFLIPFCVSLILCTLLCLFFCNNLR